MSVLPVLAFYVAMSAGNPAPVDKEPRSTVVSRSRPIGDLASKISKATRDEISKIYEAAGYVKVVRGLHTYLFSKDVWQQDRIDLKLKALSELLSKMDKDGVVAASEVPGLVDYLAPAFNNAHAKIGGDSYLQFVVSSSSTLTVGDKSITVPVGPSGNSNPISATLRNHPLQEGDPSKSSDAAPLEVMPLFDVHFEDYGPGSSRLTVQTQDYAEAMSVLEEHFRPYDDKRVQLRLALIKKIFNRDLQNVQNGNLNSLGSAPSNTIQTLFSQRWQQFGFSDSADASTFLERASVNTGATLLVAGASGRNTIEIGFL